MSEEQASAAVSEAPSPGPGPTSGPLSESEEASLRTANRRKRLFMALYFPFVMAAAVHAGVRLFADPLLLAWWGPVIVFVAAFGTLSFIMAPSVVRTSRSLPLSLGLISVAVGIALGGALLQEGTGILPIIYSLAGAAGWLAYDFWYSQLGGTEHSQIEVGKPLPEFELENPDGGEKVSSSQFQGHPLFLMFYRGNWCPLCTAQIREIAGQYQQLHDRGVRMVFASPQSQKHTRQIAAKFDVPLEFLCDPGGRAARQLGLLHVDGIPPGMGNLGFESDTVFPTIVVADADGTVRYAEVSDNYRVRPEPASYLKLLES